MKKALISIILLIFTSALFASPSIYIQGDFNAIYTTNMFSNPLPKNVDNAWLQNKIENPFIKRLDFGGSISSSLFFSKDGRTGLSTKLRVGVPFKATETRPNSTDYTSDWYYESCESTNQKLSIIGSFGPIFRAQLGPVDLGIALRASIGTLNLGDKSLIVGLQAEPYINYFFTSYAYISAGFAYDAHIMRFIEDENKYYEENFFKSSLTPFIGLGLKFGDRSDE